ncbi:hypothetical protein L226DRAFT_202607 [Lentinus tigrinus ALCF2SS1-7]|uniref:Uncharacterized protein n=1 Tax=Lentinus tigrinus ALCF2SS1-6 TaxID=1328759 RepID=A0A5C2STY6_9APHY|nr:hypothetical protein L227DRAFT_148838 [Lentinus tigrinus ALCF2SS1-6]RPD80506.1 hypothetical protein L226DRAFT_202607 [Lentinus tigrinus ALCF2SS1-7]
MPETCCSGAKNGPTMTSSTAGLHHWTIPCPLSINPCRHPSLPCTACSGLTTMLFPPASPCGPRMLDTTPFCRLRDRAISVRLLEDLSYPAVSPRNSQAVLDVFVQAYLAFYFDGRLQPVPSCLEGLISCTRRLVDFNTQPWIQGHTRPSTPPIVFQVAWGASRLISLPPTRRARPDPRPAQPRIAPGVAKQPQATPSAPLRSESTIHQLWWT